MTRVELLNRIAERHPVADRAMFRGVLDLFFEVVLGVDDGQPMTDAAHRQVLAALEQERDRLVAEAGFSSVEQMEAAR